MIKMLKLQYKLNKKLLYCMEKTLNSQTKDNIRGKTLNQHPNYKIYFLHIICDVNPYLFDIMTYFPYFMTYLSYFMIHFDVIMYFSYFSFVSRYS